MEKIQENLRSSVGEIPSEDDVWNTITEEVDTGPKWKGMKNIHRKIIFIHTIIIITKIFLFFLFPFSELDTKGKILRVVSIIARFILVLGFLYLFICSIDILSSAFQLLGGEKPFNFNFQNFFSN